MGSEEAWLFFHDEEREKIDVNDVLKAANSVCILIGFQLGNSWKIYVRELHMFPWSNLYLTSLELEHFGERTKTKQLEGCILYAINDMEVYKDHNAEKVMNDSVVRKDEDPVNINVTISEMQS